MTLIDLAYAFWGLVVFIILTLTVLLLGRAFDNIANSIDEEDKDACPECNDNNLIRFSSLDKSVCSQCGMEIPWRLKPGQPPLVSSSRDRRKYKGQST